MDLFLKIVVFILICAAVVLAALGVVLFPVREPGTAALRAFLAILLFAGLAYTWYRLNRRVPTEPQFYVAGLVLVLLPLAWFLFSAGTNGYVYGKILLFDRQLSLENYSEEPIVWDGFDGPVGLRVQLELKHPVAIEGYLRNPKLLLGNAAVPALETPRKSYWSYCSEPVKDLVSCLTAPLWPMREFPALADAESTLITYELYPSNLFYLESPQRLCLKTRQPYITGNFEVQSVTALWHLVGSGRDVDLSRRFSRLLQAQSAALKDGEQVEQWLLRMQSGSLLAAGYENCEIKQAIRYNEETECYCRSSGNPPTGSGSENDTGPPG